MDDRNNVAAASCRWARSRHRGFSLFEFVVVIGIVALLAGLFLSRIPAWQARAEMAAMEHVVGSLRSALTIKVAQSIARGNTAGIRYLAGSNPMDRLSEAPGNYLGVLTGENAASVKGGVWYFDARYRTLVYRVRHQAYFNGGFGYPPSARFFVHLVYAQDGGRRSRQRRREVVGVRLAPLEPYTWRSAPGPVATN